MNSSQGHAYRKGYQHALVDVLTEAQRYADPNPALLKALRFVAHEARLSLFEEEQQPNTEPLTLTYRTPAGERTGQIERLPKNGYTHVVFCTTNNPSYVDFVLYKGDERAASGTLDMRDEHFEGPTNVRRMNALIVALPHTVEHWTGRRLSIEDVRQARAQGLRMDTYIEEVLED